MEPHDLAGPIHPASVVLLVEDEDSLRTVVTKFLRKNGFTVLAASDGEAALELFQANRSAVHVVLLDLTLPGMSGADVFRELCRVRPDIKVILTSAYTSERVDQLFDPLQACFFLRKPFRLSELLELIRNA